MLTATSLRGLVAVGSSLPATIGRIPHPHRDKASKACRGARLMFALEHSRIAFLTPERTRIRPQSPRDHSQTLNSLLGHENPSSNNPNYLTQLPLILQRHQIPTLESTIGKLTQNQFNHRKAYPRMKISPSPRCYSSVMAPFLGFLP